MDEIHEKGLAALRLVLAFSFVSTTLHYAHNIVAVDRYPQFEGISNSVTRVSVAVAYLLFSAFGVLGYRRYQRRHYWPAFAFLLVYSISGLVTMGHFLVGVPDIPAFWFTTIFTDTLAAVAVWVFVTWGATRIGRAGDHVSTEH